MTSKAELRLRFKALFETGATVPAVGAFDPLSALLVQKAGFPVVYVGSYGVASSRGMPDVGLLTLDELVAAVRSVADAVDLPVVADAENGFYNPANIWRAVRLYERAGASAIHIDDHESGKHSDLPRRLLPLDEMLARLCAARDARDDPNFTIIARTDAAWATGNIEDAVARMIAFAGAGAEVVFATGINATQLAAVRERIPAHVVLVNTPPETLAQERAARVQMVIYHNFCLNAATHGVARALAQFHAALDVTAAADLMDKVDDVEALLDYQGYNQRGAQYGMR
ncbi:oxaloacetate decarboxylase [Cupriavidus sp. WS]|uniref:isocitrate lyase/PEP mutase family protein n=1 Tax=Cupriavidus sp. WS TaxID=1312922 RepID=UPI0003731934|nr:isocitrate lyase/PEP mutase family protein [Cupriavidus sp. WS]